MDHNKIPPPPEIISSGSVLSRLIDGLAFRYKWATEGLTASNLKFKPCASSMDIISLLKHIYHLAYVTDKVLNNQEIENTVPPLSFDSLRNETILLYKKNSEELKKMSDSELSACTFRRKNQPIEYPFWNLINGPISDALTHIGQLTSWRRIAGNPIQKIDVFKGEPLN